MKKMASLIVMIMFLTVPPLAISGLATSFVDVVVDNLQPGSSYSMQKIFQMPYSVRNNGNATSIKIKIHEREQQYLKKDYESPPDCTWFRLAKTNFIDVKPGETVTNDIIISIPEDNDLLNRKFQVSIEAETFNYAGATADFDFAVESSLCFSVASVRIKVSKNEEKKQ